MTKGATKSGRKLSISGLKKKLDAIFSLYIRNRDKGICFTCGKVGEIKEMQCGHYWSRSYNSTRFDEKNCHCQCVGCNVFKSGNKEIYTLNLIQKYGKRVLEELNKKRLQVKQFSTSELQDLIEHYKTKTNAN